LMGVASTDAASICASGGGASEELTNSSPSLRKPG
jgi:hypothetical protein